MNKLILLSAVVVLVLFHQNTFAIYVPIDSVKIGTPEKIDTDKFWESYYKDGYYLGTPLNPFSPTSVYTIYFYIPVKALVQFNILDTNNVLISKINSFELEKGFYKTRFEWFAHKSSVFDLEMSTRLFKGKLRFYLVF